MNFRRLKLKKLIATCYIGSPIAENEIGLFKDGYIADEPIPEKGKRAIQFRISEIPDMNGDGAIDLRDAEILIQKRHPYRILYGDDKYPAGDFRSKECIELLKEADIVVTNPPFSIATEFIDILTKYNKFFLIIGDLNWITYSNVFPLIKDNQIWTGYNSVKEFMQRNGTFKKFGNKLWFTNLDIPKYHEDLILTETYSPEKYPKYDNYNAIEVSRTVNIPIDYTGAMGVPVSFLTKYNAKQFEIIGATESEGKGFSNGLWTGQVAQALVNGQRVYKRLFIRHKRKE